MIISSLPCLEFWKLHAASAGSVLAFIGENFYVRFQNAIFGCLLNRHSPPFLLHSHSPSFPLTLSFYPPLFLLQPFCTYPLLCLPFFRSSPSVGLFWIGSARPFPLRPVVLSTLFFLLCKLFLPALASSLLYCFLFCCYVLPLFILFTVLFASSSFFTFFLLF